MCVLPRRPPLVRGRGRRRRLPRRRRLLRRRRLRLRAARRGGRHGAGRAPSPRPSTPGSSGRGPTRPRWASTRPSSTSSPPLAEQRGRTACVVIRQGQIVGEWYWDGTDASSTQEVFSATKSYASTLVGIAQAEGDLDIDDPASEYIDAWAGTDRPGRHGRQPAEQRLGPHVGPSADYRQLPGRRTWTPSPSGSASRPAPGTTWAYNNAAIQTLDAVLAGGHRRVAGHLRRGRLFGPLGMDDSRHDARPRRQHQAVHGPAVHVRGHGPVRLPVPARRRVGRRAGRPGGLGRGRHRRPRPRSINDAYGYLWWLNHRGTSSARSGATTADQAGGGPDTQLVPGAPEDMYFALGLGNQIIAVDPASETVVVRLGVGAPGAPRRSTRPPQPGW